MKRRSFLKACASSLGAGAVSADSIADGQEAAVLVEPKAAMKTVPRRPLGRTDERVSIIGYPGFALHHGNQEEGTRSLRRAFDQGINYFDVAPAYGDAEEKMGIGLEGLDRDQLFIACKTKMRDKEGARKELDRSLTRLKTDHFDLYQMHCLIKLEEVEQAFGPGGAMETFQKAKQEGKVRFFGFSAHNAKAAEAAMQRFRFDTVMFPINFVEYMTFGFGKSVLKLAAEQGVSVVAIKPMSGGAWTGELKTNRQKRPRKWWYRTLEEMQEIDLALRFTLSLKPVVVGIPPAWLDLADKAFEAGKNYRDITEAETEQLRQMAAKCESVFRHRDQVARHGLPHDPRDFDSPHEGCPGMYA